MRRRLSGRQQARPQFSHAELSTPSIGIASLPFGYKAAVDGFELGDAGDELSACGPRFRHRVESRSRCCSLSRSARSRMISSRASARSVRVASGVVLLVSIPGTFDDAEQPRRVRGRPGRTRARSTLAPIGHGWERDRLACCLKVLNGIERTSPLVTAVGSSGGHEGRGASGCHRQLRLRRQGYDGQRGRGAAAGWPPPPRHVRRWRERQGAASLSRPPGRRRRSGRRDCLHVVGDTDGAGCLKTARRLATCSSMAGRYEGSGR